MEYHLPRVVEWINNRGVQFYPTIDWAQLCLSPFAEYAMLHLDLLYGSDRLVALVQWFSYVGCIVAVSLLAKELGRHAVFANHRSGIRGVRFQPRFWRRPGTRPSWSRHTGLLWLHISCCAGGEGKAGRTLLAIGAALGLAVFTKGTSYVFLPCIALACILTWDGAATRRFLLRLPAIAALGAAGVSPIVGAQLSVQRFAYGPPVFLRGGQCERRMYANARVTPALALANVVRNVALHAGVPSDRINALTTPSFSGVILAMGVDPNDPGQMMASQLGYMPRFAVRFHPRNEVLSEDPCSLLLFVLAGVLVFCVLAASQTRYAGSGWGWWARLFCFAHCCGGRHGARGSKSPVFVLGAALQRCRADAGLPDGPINTIAGWLLLLALPLALANEVRPLVTRHGLRRKYPDNSTR